MTWLDDIEERSGLGEVPPGTDPWVPPILSRLPVATFARLTYVVLDDFDRADIVLSRSPWPTIDTLGRVRHVPQAAVEESVPGDEWMALMTERRAPAVLRDRPPRIGDAFAMMLRDGDPLHPVGPVVDVTADARDAARAAFYGAVTLPLDRAVAKALREPENTRKMRVDVPAEWVEQ